MIAVDQQLETQDAAYLRGIVTQLCVQAADRVESESIEIKGWCREAKDLFEKLGEFAACLANANGGFSILGVEEEGNKAGRFRRCPHGVLTAEMLWRKLNDVTIPPVKCTVYDISDIVADVTGIAEAQAFALKIPKTEKMNGHMTVKGVSKIRVGKECRPNFTAEDDQTRTIVPGATFLEISERSVQWAMASHQRHFPKRIVTWTSPEEFLTQAGLLIEHRSQTSMSPISLFPLAAILLFGTEQAIGKYAGHCETVIKTPLGTTNLRKNIIDSFRDLCSTKASLVSAACPQVSLDTLKELIVNAFAHRCYRVASGIVIEASSEAISIQSPGGLAAGLNVTNLLHCVPVYRNLLLAEGARFSGLSDKFGQGINMIYRAVLQEGFDFPIFENEGGCFTVLIPTKGSANFKEFVRKRSQSLVRLDEVVSLRVLFANQCATLDELASAMQRGREQGRRILAEMIEKVMVQLNDDGSYSLAPIVRSDIDNVFNSDQLLIGLDLYGDGFAVS
jgi:ATP-dependent DNA helicase RecG